VQLARNDDDDDDDDAIRANRD